ncbi:MAG: DUF1269 domain-containing protein [Ilumatobacter sp.]|nr:DUF1269 domain-containing protein [Ilumatobacter sp.]
MATLTVWKFDDAEGAERVKAKLEGLEKQELINIVDVAMVSWPDGRKKPKTRQGFSTTAAGAASGSLWGLLFGVIFFVPLFGALVGAAAGALSGSLTDIGIDDDFISSVRDQVTEGTSALFLMSTDAVLDRVLPAVAGEDMELITTNLSGVDEATLREFFAH